VLTGTVLASTDENMLAWDAIVVGAGPAGLSAALVLGRCRRRVLVYDDDSARNRVSTGIHGFIGHDGIPPHEFRQRALAELSPYGVEVRRERVLAVTRTAGGFSVRTSVGAHDTARKLLLATGIKDTLPELPGAREFYGRGLFPCAYCDGWEFRDRRLGAYAWGTSAADFALGLTTWSGDVVLFTDGKALPGAAELARLERHSVALREERVSEFVGGESGLQAVVLASGERVRCDAVFLHSGHELAAPSLAAALGCEFEPGGPVRTFEKQTTNVPGLYLAGDAAHDVKFAIVAAAHGARAAHEINQALRQEDTP
jgi:thioredoxin reductase